MKLKELLKGVEIISAPQDLDIEIESVHYNSKEVKENSLFVAIEGLEVDGHKYIEDAIKRGAVAVLVTKDVKADVPTIKTENNRKSLAIISNNFFGYPTHDMTLVGITASNGKTSTSMMLKSIMDANDIKNGIIGTVMYKFAGVQIASKLTTPESLELQGYFSKMLVNGITTAIMEVSSIAQEMYRNYGCKYDVVCMNNITREHIDQHGSFEKYFEEKQKLIVNAEADTYVVLNAEDEYVKTLVDKTKGKVITYSDKNSNTSIYAKDIDITSGFGNFTVVIPKAIETKKGMSQTGEYKVALKVAGYHSIFNSLSAFAMALALGYDVESILKGLENYSGIERRFQLVYDEEYKILDDHFANMGNIDISLETLSKMKYNKLHMVYAIRGNRGVTVNGENVDTIIKWLAKVKYDSFASTKSVEIVESHDKVSDDEEKVFTDKMEKAGIDFTLYQRMDEALYSALDKAEEGDVILMAGCQGMDFGAKCILEEIVKRHPEKDKEKVLLPLKDRVAGV